MSAKSYEIHILEKEHSPKFYVVDKRTGQRFGLCEWPPELNRLGSDYANEHSDFIVDEGYAPEDVKCYFVERGWLDGKLYVFVELSEDAEQREISAYNDRLLKASIGADTTGNYNFPLFFHPKKRK